MRKQPPKQLKTLENLLQQAEHYAEYMMSGSSASVPPTLTALTSEGFIMHIPKRFNNETDKDLFAKTIRLMAVGYKASAVAMISESWIVAKKRRDRELDLSVPPSQSPDREEVVSIMAESREIRAQKVSLHPTQQRGKVHRLRDKFIAANSGD